ncbi:MAG: hypothetical protein KME55_36995 [Nostoc indistinguendum CM1-VF10]|nr:hypothetical protein [Nostoc indistinguendum CM1-VF10]
MQNTIEREWQVVSPKLQGLEDKFPCATWLPMIYQNLAEIPLTWYQ